MRKWMIPVTAGLCVAGLMAQPPGEMMRHPGPGGPPPMMAGPGMVHFAGDMKVVKGQPYSAEVTNETVQVLGDGTRIAKKSTGSVYRDGEGRTRREDSGSGGATQDVRSINIFDPVAGVSYMLNPSSKSAVKMAAHVPPASDGTGDPAPRRAMRTPAPAGAGSPDGTAGQPRQRRDNHNRTVEDLGFQAVEGVQAQGKRTTTTIPVGAMGNDREIKIVDETWFSQDLRVVVQSHHSDPWTGDVTYKLVNIKRAEPAHALFEAPADYQVKERGHGAAAGHLQD